MPSDDSKGRRRPGSQGPRIYRDDESPAPREKSVSPRGQGGKRGGKKKRRKKTKASGGWFRRIFLSRRALSLYGSIGLTLFLAGLVTLIYLLHDLPDISGLAAPRKNPGIQILAADKTVIANYGDVYGEFLQYKELPKPLIDAVIATEDRDFFHHFGIDPMGIARAMVVNISKRHFVQGGSTITQQLAKNVFLTPDRTIKRKVQEMVLAFWLEKRFSKQEILSIYLNRVYLGAGNYGVDAAARQYFNKSAHELTLGEAAILAGLLKAPSRYAPTANPDLAMKRGKQVLLNMVDAGFLDASKVEHAFDGFAKKTKQLAETGRNARYFTDWIIGSLEDYIGQVDQDIIIETTFDLKQQQYAEAAIEALLTPEQQAKKNVHQAALVSMKPDGAVTAMLGGLDYGESQYNRAVQAKRQPGSAFKMFVYLAAMENGFNPDMMVEDVAPRIGKWQPENYEGKQYGMVSLRYAVAESINTVAVSTAQRVGIRNVINAARRLGVTSELPASPSLALGAGEVDLLEMTTAYAHLAANGKGVRPYGINRIVRKKDGQAIYQYEPPLAYTVISSNVVAEMNSMLSGVLEYGTARASKIGRPAAGKTGTTSDYKDAWFIGYTPDQVTGVWVGNDDTVPMKKVTGGMIPARIWANFMQKALQKVPAKSLPVVYSAGAGGLPWNPGAPEGTGEGAPSDQAPGRPNAPQQGEPDLSPGFWDKLFGNSKVEYTYPDGRR